MGYYEIELKLPTDYDDNLIIKSIQEKQGFKNFEYKILKKSLDARKKNNIVYVLQIGIFSQEIKNSGSKHTSKLDIISKKRTSKIIIVGNGPAGFFCSYTLAKAGFSVTCLEQGCAVDQRVEDIKDFENEGILKVHSNYVFGEGGAGTFSDGKLTTRTKKIAVEKAFILDAFIQAGAPEEIKYLNHPHIGSDNLKIIVKNLRDMFQFIGGKTVFETKVIDFKIKPNNQVVLMTEKKEYTADYIFFAPGNSAYDTYRMLMKNNIAFNTKPFAVGVRVEHLQSDINTSQWKVPELKGVKAAEYRLTYTTKNNFPVYSFCMCPGGKILCSASKPGQSNVNGASHYLRDSKWANSAIVVGINFKKLFNKEFTPTEALDWVESLEKKAFSICDNYQAPFNTIEDFIHKKITSRPVLSSYNFPLIPYDYKKLLPAEIEEALREGLIYFSQKIKCFNNGIMVGLETKTSPPIQVVRDSDYTCNDQKNIYVIGEGSGHASGIITSAVDGIKVALSLIERLQ
jgi:uncharacterized protein